MRCPRCNFEGELLRGGCARCGYGRGGVVSGSLPALSRRQAVSGPLNRISQPLVLRREILRQGRYHLVKELVLPPSQEGQGKAWLATDAQQANNVVVVREVIPPQGSPAVVQQEMRALALRFAELGRQEGFPAVLDGFWEQGSHYLVLEHVKGRSLAHLLQESGVLEERMVAEYGRQVCESLQVLVSLRPPLVHGSINPETIIVSPDGRYVSLINLPLFAPTQSPLVTAKASSGYLAPEQVRGNAVTASDLYGLGASLYHALTEYDPDKHMSFFFPPARRLNPSVTPRMEALLARALRLSLAQRYTQPAEMQKDLQTLLAPYPETDPLSADFLNRSNVLRQGGQGSGSSVVSLFAVVAVVVSILLLGGILLAIVHGPSVDRGASATATANVMQTATVAPAAQENAAMQAELVAEAQSFAKSGIGVSDGRFIFDAYTGRRDVNSKKQAAQAIQNGDLDTAAGDLGVAVASDPTDGEAQIYNEDVGILQKNLPYVTIVVGIGMDNSSEALAVDRTNLQAAFVAQYEINEFGLLPQGRQLRILIANAGLNNVDVAKTAQFLANRLSKTGNLDHIIAVVGWPSSSQTSKVVASMTAVDIPLVAQTASGVELSGSSPYFFRMGSPYNVQGNTLATIAVQQLRARTILVMRDPANVDSVALANAFKTRAQALKVNLIESAKDNFSEMTSPVSAYQPIINDAIGGKADVIFLAGSDVDAVRLAHAVGIASKSDPLNTQLAHLKILGGTALDSSLLLGQGNSMDASLARTYPQDMQRLNFIAFADANELAYLHNSLDRQTTFFTEWSGLLQNSVVATDDAPPPDQNAIMTYDAIRLLIKAATLVHGPLSGRALRDVLRSFGKNQEPAYQGVGGRLVFDGQGNPLDKAVVVLDVERVGNNNAIKIKQIIGTFK